MVTWARVLTLGVVFAAGWAGSALVPQKPARAAEAHTEAPEPTTTPSACTTDDSLTIEANANLVAQVRDYKARLALAEGRRDDAESKVAQLNAAAQLKHVSSSDEYARMSREGTLRLKLPCSSWDSGGMFSARRAQKGSLTIGSRNRRGERMQRAEMAGFSEQERETLPDVYQRAHARTWAAMRTACEATKEYRDALKEAEEPPSTDEARIEMCRWQLLSVHDKDNRSAMARVLELRAARAGIDKATSDVERVTFALTEAPQALDDEMVRAFGREKATRAADNGVTCFDETIYQLREADG